MTTDTYESTDLFQRDSGTARRPTTQQAHVEDLAFAHWQYNANEKAYANKLITKAMYEFAREELRKCIDQSSELCYSISKGG